MSVIESIDKWFDILNEWDEDIFELIPEAHRRQPPPCLNGQPYHTICCIETLKEILDRCAYLSPAFSTMIIQMSLQQGDMERALILIEYSEIDDEDLSEILNNVQDIRLLRHYKRLFMGDRPSLWDRVEVGPLSLSQMCGDIPTFISMCKCLTIEEIDLLCLCTPATMTMLHILADRVPQSWAYRVELGDDILPQVLLRNVSIEIVKILLKRSCNVIPTDVTSIMSNYPKSMDREEVFYQCLHLMDMTEYDFLDKYMKGSRRWYNYRALYLDELVRMSSTGGINDFTLCGNSVEDIPAIFSIYTINRESLHLLDVREMRKLVRDDHTYTHPYTREILPAKDIEDRLKLIIDLEVPSYTMTKEDVKEIPSSSIDEDAINTILTKHDLVFYLQDIIFISSMYGVNTVLSMDKHPNIIRFFGESIPNTVLHIYPRIREISKMCV